MALSSIPDVVNVWRIVGAKAPVDRPPQLLIELPHGATRTADYEATHRRLHGSFPKDLSDFFHVNTDAGSPELAVALAQQLVIQDPHISVLIVQALIPRTFIDVNRMLGESRETYKAGGVTPGVPPYVEEPADHRCLEQLYWAYQEVAMAAYAEVCGSGGSALLLHTYAPRTVDVQVDAQIVENLHRAYEPEVFPTWPLRPEVDVIGRTLDGELLAPSALVEQLTEGFAKIGIPVAVGHSYPLHPSTMGYHHAVRYPGQTLCLEVRRDLLAEPFDPFVQMHIGAEKTGRIARVLAGAYGAWWAAARMGLP